MMIFIVCVNKYDISILFHGYTQAVAANAAIM